MGVSANRLFLTVILGGQSMANLDSAIINVATPSIGATLGASGAELQLTVSVYVLAMAMLLVTGARLGALYGYRRMFMAGLVIFTLASLCCGLAPNAFGLIVARIAQGIGAALIVAQVMSSIQRTYTGVARTHAIGAYTTTLSLGAVTGQVLGGLLITLDLFGLTWRPLFLINVPIGIALLVAAWFALPSDIPHEGARPKLDLVGVVLLALAMLLLVLPLTIGREMHWPWWMISALFLCVPATGAFIWWQKILGERGGAPILNLPLFHDPLVVSGLAGQMCGRIAYFGLLFVLALYVQVGLHESALVSGLSLVGWIVAFGVSGIVYPRLPHRVTLLCGPIGGLILASAYAGTALITAQHIGVGWLFLVLLSSGGFGWGMAATAVTAQLSTIIAPKHAPDLSGVLATIQPVSAVLGISLFGSLYLSLTAGGGVSSAMHAFAVACAAMSVLALLMTILLWNRPRERSA